MLFQFWQAWLYGLLTTVGLSCLAVMFGTILGVTLVWVQSYRFVVLRALVVGYVVAFRAVPPLVVLLWIYYSLPMLTGVAFSAFFSSAVGLALNGAAFYAENIRAGLESVSVSQRESALSMGMNSRQVLWYIVLPQALRNMLPNLFGEYVTTIKLTSLASTIGVAELLNRGGSIIALTQQSFEVYTTLAILYLAIILPLEYSVRRLERKVFRVS